jgi:4-amino-4-deoxy-L-arabinose transferase-like glycosyltransferase
MIKRTHALLYTLERSKMFWTIFLSSLVFFILRLPSLFEPNWYGDEGIYEVIGKAMSQGRILYLQIWDNKPPLLYVTYAIFHGDQFGARMLSLLFGLGAVITLFFLAKKLFKEI